MSVNEKMTAIADAIRAYTYSTEKLGLDAMVEGIHAGNKSTKDHYLQEGTLIGIEQGKQAEYERFWDNVPDGIDRYTFAGDAWTAETFRPNKRITCRSGHPQYAFARHNYHGTPYDMVEHLAKYGGSLDISAAQNGDFLFYQANISRLPALNMAKFARYNNTFNGCGSLATIDLLTLSPTAAFTSTFTGCTSLANITIDGEIGKDISFADSPLLTTASVQSVIDHLKDLTGATAQTLTIHADVKANLTEEQLATITGKNWSVA